MWPCRLKGSNIPAFNQSAHSTHIINESKKTKPFIRRMITSIQIINPGKIEIKTKNSTRWFQHWWLFDGACIYKLHYCVLFMMNKLFQLVEFQFELFLFVCCVCVVFWISRKWSAWIEKNGTVRILMQLISKMNFEFNKLPMVKRCRWCSHNHYNWWTQFFEARTTYYKLICSPQCAVQKFIFTISMECIAIWCW